MAPELMPLLVEGGRRVVPLGEARELIPSAVILASNPETRGVLEILDFLDHVI